MKSWLLKIFIDLAYAQSPGPGGVNLPPSGNGPGGVNAPIEVPADTGGILQNYLKSGIDSIPQLISYILKLAAMIGLPIVVLFIMWAGFMYVTARGDQAKIRRAHDAFLYSMVGAALVLGAAVIAAAIQGTISNLSV